MRTDMPFDQHRTSTGLVDVLDRVLDKGLLIAGDIRVSLAEVELLTIRIRLIVCSIDKAQEIGHGLVAVRPAFLAGAQVGRSVAENEELKRQIRSAGAAHRSAVGGTAPPAVQQTRSVPGASRRADRSMSDAR